MLQNFKPLLAGKVETDDDLTKLCYPMIASPKLDGIRVLIHPEHGPVTRKLLKLPNKATAKALSEMTALAGADGELVIGSPYEKPDSTTFNRTSSAVMSHEGEPEVTFFVFDYFGEDLAGRPYTERMAKLPKAVGVHKGVSTVALEWKIVHDPAEVVAYEIECLERGFEGIMLRKPDMPYKFGRSSLNAKQQHLVKMKRFEDAEGEIIGFHEEMENTNEKLRDELGHAKRSSAQAGKVGKSTLGKLTLKILNGPFKDVEVNVGSGFTQELRQRIWDRRTDYLHKVVTFKYQPHGSMDKPRIPIFKGFRSKADF